MTDGPQRPSWDLLFEQAVGQEGLFTTRQAAEAGYSPQLLAHYVRTGRIRRIRRGIYRLVHFPYAEGEELAAAWLWSAREGVFSHETALSLHELSDVLPSKLHLTLPLSWRHRRLDIPEGLVLHFADVPESERAWYRSVPVTSPSRSLIDSARADFAPDQLQRAVAQALGRGLVDKRELAEIEPKLAPYMTGTTRDSTQEVRDP